MAAADSAAPKRLLIVTDEMEVGGSQRQIAHLLGALDRRDWQADLAYFRKRSFLADTIEAHGVPVHRVAKRGRVDPRFLLALARLLRRGRYDIVHCYSFTAELWVRIALYLAPGAMFIASMRDMGHGLSPRQWAIKRRICRGARAIISNSTGAAERLRHEIGGGAPPVHVVPNGIELPVPIDADRRERLRADLGADADRALGLFVGRLAHQKNVHLLLDALAALETRTRPSIALVGSGDLRGELEARVQALGLAGEVRFLGERDDARELMQAADLFVLPSRDEGLSNVVLEAMACGCAVVATRVGGNPEVIDDGVNGLLVDSGDRVALSAALRRLATEPALRDRLGSAARERVARAYSIPALAAATAAVYRSCLQR
ncbi:MAG: glycosyltransferase [Lysobacterales bacterium]